MIQARVNGIAGARDAGVSDDGTRILDALRGRVSQIADVVRQSDVWDAVVGADSPSVLVLSTLREIMWSIHQYQAHTTEAGFSMIGRLPKSEVKLIMSLSHHKAEEAEHGLWARRDYLLLGGSEAAAASPPTPAVFAVISVWDRIAACEDPLSYLGAEYLFEALTLSLAPSVLASLASHAAARGNVGFIAEHASEDVKHTRLLEHWIVDVTQRYPESGAAMLRSFDYFANVYPLPVWEEALTRARSGLSMP
jgi:hypothetical protein